MARKRPLRSPGTLVVCEHTSKVLADNPLGDPHVRRLAVWLPAEYDEAAVLHRPRRETRTEARLAVFTWIEGWYNPRRRHSALEYLSPVNFERRSSTPIPESDVPRNEPKHTTMSAWESSP